MICSSIRFDKDPADLVDQLALKSKHRRIKRAPIASEVEYHDTHVVAGVSSLHGNIFYPSYFDDFQTPFVM